jgi:hypothetical protein
MEHIQRNSTQQQLIVETVQRIAQLNSGLDIIMLMQLLETRLQTLQAQN